MLTSEQYAVLRRGDNERPWTSPLNKEHRTGAYLCVGCGLPLFSSGTKFESGTGGGHLEHVLKDGPQPTALMGDFGIVL
jgi:peptide methionine sulfoxide reductase MsrB